jgi:hypothetical protein
MPSKAVRLSNISIVIKILIECIVIEWKKKDKLLSQCMELQAFNREADRFDVSTGAHEAFLEFQDLGVIDLLILLFRRSLKLVYSKRRIPSNRSKR